MKYAWVGRLMPLTGTKAGMLAIGALIGCSGSVFAAPIVGSRTLTFEGLQDNESILEYYNGGLGSKGSGPGPADNISFDAHGKAFIDTDHGGTGTFDNNPSGHTALSFNFNPSIGLLGSVMNVHDGFTQSLSGYYASSAGDEIDIYSGENLTGTLLASIDLASTPLNFSDASDLYGTFNAFNLNFAGVAHSAYIGTINTSFFDSLTLGPAALPSGGAVPLPSGAWAGLATLAGLACFAWGRKAIV